MEAPDVAVPLEDDRRVAEAAYARPFAARVILDAVHENRYRPESDGRARRDGYFALGIESAEERHAVVGGHGGIGAQRREVSVPDRHDCARSVVGGVVHAVLHGHAGAAAVPAVPDRLRYVLSPAVLAGGGDHAGYAGGDLDVAAGASVRAANAGRAEAAVGDYDASVDFDVAAVAVEVGIIAFVDAADAGAAADGTRATAAGRLKRAGACDRELIAWRDVDAGIPVSESGYRVDRPLREDQRRVAKEV